MIANLNANDQWLWSLVNAMARAANDAAKLRKDGSAQKSMALPGASSARLFDYLYKRDPA
jgi:hypothetical protein